MVHTGDVHALSVWANRVSRSGDREGVPFAFTSVLGVFAMSKRSLCLLPLFLLMSGLLVTTSQASGPPVDSFGARLATYDKDAGESYFALIVAPKVRLQPATVQDVVVLVDTSASQRGLFREDSLLAVKTLVRRLDPRDRVRLFAVDLEAVALCDQFVEAGSKEMKEALDKLERAHTTWLHGHDCGIAGCRRVL